MSRADDLNKQLAGLSPAKRALLERKRKQESASAPPLRARERGEHAPLSFAQQRLWLIHQLDPNSYLYNVPRAIRIRGKLDIELLESALNEVIRRHEVLRTRFVADTDGPVQKVTPELRVSLPVTEIASADQIHPLALSLYHQPFDLQHGPLLRTQVLRLNAADHVLLLVMHHIVSDGWTGGLLFDELGKLYANLSAERQTALPELPIQYADYAAWQREWMQGAALEAEVGYWRDHLTGTPECLELPTDRPRPADASYRGKISSLLLTEALSNNVKAFSRAHGVTLFTTLMAGLNVLLYRWTGQEDVVVGTVSANRNRAEIEKLIGCFINFLPVRHKIARESNALDLIAQVNKTLLGAIAHQDCPFEKIIEAVNPRRALNVNPLYNAALLMQNFPEIAFTAGTLEARFLELDTEVAFLDQRFVASDTLRGIQLQCEYNVDLFDAGTIDALLHGYASVLEQMVAAPDKKLVEFEISAALVQQAAAARRRERKQKIAIAATFTAEPVEESLTFWMQQLGLPCEVQFAAYNQVFQELLDPGSLLSRNAEGINVLLVRLEDWILDRDDSATSDKVERNAHELMDALKSAGERTGAPYVLCLCPPSAAILANHDLATLLQRTEEMLAAGLRDSSGVHVITSSELLKLYPVSHYDDEYAHQLGHIPYTAALFAALGTMVTRKIRAIRSLPHKVIVLDCDQTLWKGVCGEDGPLAVEVDAARRAFQEMLVAQYDAGMLLCLCSKNAEEDVMAVFEQNTGMLLRLEHLVSWRINWEAKSENLKQLAQELELGLDSFIFIDDNPLECAEVQATCAEVLTLALPEKAEDIPEFLRHVWAFDHARITEEDKQRTALYRQNVEREQLRKSSQSLDEFLSGLELHVDIDPLKPEDLARVSQLTERTNQFNCTTIRRSESDIEKLCRNGAECLTVRVKDRFGDYGLVGVVIFSAASEALAIDTFLLSCRVLGRKVEHQMLATLGRIAQERGLPRVDVDFAPTKKNKPALDFLESLGAEVKQQDGGSIYRFPATHALNAIELGNNSRPSEPAGKQPGSQQSAASAQNAIIARIASDLRHVEQIAHAIESQKELKTASAGSFVAPRTPTEEIVAGIWARLLRVERVGIHDNFFALGGHSLVATQVIARVRQTLEVELPLRSIFEAPSLGEFCSRIEGARGETAAVPPLVRKPHNNKAPLSFAQQRLWFLDQLEPGNPLYNIPQMIRMRGNLDVAALDKAINEVVRRHEALRTTFATDANQPVQVIAPELRLIVGRVDVPSFGQADAQVQRLARDEATTPFDLSRGPLLRAKVLRVSAEEHVLLLTMHHIVSDRWSMGVLAEELEALYTAFVQAHPSPLPELPVQYADYARWQQEWLRGEVLDAEIAYWKKQLAGAPQLLELPTDRPRPAVQTYRGASQSHLLSKDLVAKLTALSQTEGVTLFMTLLAAFQTMLSRYAAQDDIVIGSPIANRSYAEVELLIGFFVNTLAFRTDLSGDPTFRELLGRVREVALGAYAHQEIPFEKLVEELQPERSLSHNPIFQVLFALQNAPMQALELAGLMLEKLPVYTGTSMFDMSWFAVEVPDGLVLRAEYNTDLFDDVTITRALGHFENLLKGILAHPERRVTELPLLAESERQRMLVEFNQTAAEFPNICLHEFTAAQAERTPEAVAAICGQEQITYRDLNARANQFAHYLQKCGVDKEVLVGIYLERSIDMLVALLGVLKAGGAYVPLDPAFPKDRIGFIIHDANAPVLVTQASLVPSLPEHSAQVLTIDSEWTAISRELSEDPVTSTGPENVAYVLYTSGSTGKPKGVQVEHRNVVNFLESMRKQPGMTADDTLLAVTTLSFDIAGLELYLPLVTGAKVVLASGEQAMDGKQLLELLNAARATVMQATPATWRMLIQSGWQGSPQLKVLCGGEALPADLADQLLPRCTELWNMYGPTETTIWSSVYRVQSRPDTTAPIGGPIANTTMYVLDAHQQPTPLGVAGELFIGGDGVARGYLNRRDLTTEKFVADPFRPGSRLYRTGDLAKCLPNGNIQFLGRADFQVKLRGFRIELGEIESVLATHPRVQQAVALVREDQPGDKRLVAYIVSNNGGAPDSADLRNHLKQSLPDYMIPSAFVALDAFPLTPNGKINRRALPPPEYTPDEQTFVAPRTPVEEAVAAIWAEVLRVERISANDDFFGLGGHSLLATQVISRLRQAFEIELPLRAMFEAPSLSQLAARVENAQRGLEISPVRRIPRDRALPLSFAQQRLWFLDQFEPNNPLYNIPWALQITGKLDAEALEQSLNAVVERHEALRTTFHSLADQPVQVIAPSLRIPLSIVDLSGLPAAEKQLRASQSISEEAERSFNLARGPLLRATLLRLDDQEHVLVLNIHHIISDRWSMGVLSQELAALYTAHVEGQPSDLKDLAVQYADFAAWQREFLKGKGLEKLLAYWKQQLKDAPPVLELPTDRPRLAVESFRGAVVTHVFPQALSERLKSISREKGATLFMTLLAGFQALLARYSGQDDIVVGAPVANRNRAETESLIGFFANTLALRARFGSEPTFAALLDQAKEVTLSAYAHEDLPFEKLVEELRPERSLSHNPLVQVFFVLQNAPMETLRLKGLHLKPIETETKSAKGDLFFSLVETAEGIRGRLEYNTDLFDAVTVKRMLRHYQALLEAAVANPEMPVAELPLLSSEERQQLVGEWNSTEFDYPRHLCLHELFEQQAERSPDAIACMHGDQQLSYGELNRRANQLAHYLKQRGMGPGQRVGIFVERSLAMMVGLLGIQKSGAAYVPLDPAYPAERLRLIVDDAQLPVIVTQASLVSGLPAHAAEVICLDRDWNQIASQSSTNPQSGASPEDLVYVIFTSGSTGRPKGVQVPHRAVVNLLWFMSQELRMTAQDVFPALASFAFDMCIPELYLGLVSGGRVVIADRHLAANGEELAALLRQTGATVVHATPTTWNLLLEAGFTGKGLKRVIGAEPLPKDLCRRLLQADASLYNFYGPTETTVWSSFHHFRSPDEPVVVGRPLANTQVYILDRNLQPVPIGVPGEIHIAGEGVTCGYLKRPELTAEKFIADPFADKAGAKMYRTGDLGRFLADGRIEFQGRVDNQVKVRGYRIELGEIEAVLGKHAEVQECAVIAREDVPGDKRLAAYFVASNGTAPDVVSLRNWVKERLPDYMVPVAFVAMERLPLSPNGKVNRKALPVPDYARPELSGSYQQARTPVEEMLAGIWAEVLKLDAVGVHDNFFELGGHSLLATQVVSRIRRTFQVDLPLRGLFEAPTVAGLAHKIESLEKGVQSPPITRAPREHNLPLSFAQQRLWFLDQLEPNNPLYNVPYIVRMRGKLNGSVLERSLNEIVRRHETLRTTFHTVNDEPVQRIAPSLQVPLALADLTGTPVSDRESEARRLAMEEVKRPFHLGAGPLVRASLFKLDEEDHALVINTHHIISDRWSLGVLSQELAALYEAFLDDKVSPLPDLPIQYADYAGWQRQFLSGETLEKQLAYWRAQLAGAPAVLDLPTDHPRQAIENFWGGVHQQPLAEGLVASLRSLSRRNGVTFFMPLLAAFQAILARYSGQDDIVVGTDLANRTQLETEKLIGFFVNVLPMRMRFSGDFTFRDILEREREAALGAFAHQDVPFEKLVEELRPERNLKHNPLVQVLFVMQNTPQIAREFGGLKLGPLGVSSTSRFDLVLFINNPDESPYATWMYNPNLFEGATIARMAALYQSVLQTVAADPEIRFETLCDRMADFEQQQQATEQKQFEETSRRKLKSIRRRAMTQS